MMELKLLIINALTQNGASTPSELLRFLSQAGKPQRLEDVVAVLTDCLEISLIGFALSRDGSNENIYKLSVEFGQDLPYFHESSDGVIRLAIHGRRFHAREIDILDEEGGCLARLHLSASRDHEGQIGIDINPNLHQTKLHINSSCKATALTRATSTLRLDASGYRLIIEARDEQPDFPLANPLKKWRHEIG